MSPHLERHRSDSPYRARMDLVALDARQGHDVCVARLLVLYRLDLTDHKNVNHDLSQELPAGGYRRIMQSLPDTRLRGIMPRYAIVFAFETSTPNLMCQQKDHLSFQPCQPPQCKTNLGNISRGIILKNPAVAVSNSPIPLPLRPVPTPSSTRLLFSYLLTSIIPSPY